MTPQLQQAIRLLQLSTLDLKQEIQDALDSNLMLETEEEGLIREQQGPGLNGEEGSAAAPSQDATNDVNNEREIDVETPAIPDELPVDTAWEDIYDSGPVSATVNSSNADEGNEFLNQQSRSQTLRDYLQWQLNLSTVSEVDAIIAALIVDSIDDDGYLGTSVEQIVEALDDPETGVEEVEAVLHLIQSFDPPGVGARDLRESLMIQLRQLPHDTPYRSEAIALVRDFFELLATQDEAQIRRRMKLEGEDLAHTVRFIRTLNPRPGTTVVIEAPAYVEPDVFVFKRNGRWLVELNSEAAPRLRVNADYASLIRRADNSSDNTTLKNHLQEARWFIKSLQSRNDTLLKVATKIVEIQRGYFEHGEEAMKPLVLRDIAEALEMHESTISRVTSQKYMYTPKGTLEFKYFFSSHVNTASGGEASATAIRALIKKLIAAEKPAKPLSDNKIASLLKDQGIQVARRTVAKYRESMAIPPSNERKRLA